MHKIIAAALIAVGLALSGFFIAQAITAFKMADRYVTVKGLAERIVKADDAVWQIYFTYGSDDLAGVYEGIQSAQEKVVGFLTTQGFALDEIELKSVAMTDNQSASYSGNQNAKRYVANAGVTLHTAEVDNVRKAVQETSSLVQDGLVVTRTEVRYDFTHLNNIKPEMLDEATEAATVAANTFATNSQSRIAGIRKASQGLFTISDASSGSYGTDIMKKVRVVTTTDYYLR